eukprot:CAMPEP_0172917904 /NCGR_PEP_ID=MMETSP1075-20121228/199150_1 /TAXON_ID=2916 /ORGANISM="Ceratium fusus, Strain PA161109" /LENGTH=334 /DNA_ID=CAMNT_0013777447 /DNA_START=12 /DNA_END=1016 /DNA_ORIENTATION=+
MASSSIHEVWKLLEAMDRRQSSLESNVRDLRNTVQLWSDIIQEGLADLSVQMKVVTLKHRCEQRMHSNIQAEDESTVIEQLSNIEQRKQTKHSKIQEGPEFDAHMCKAEKQLQELQMSVRDMKLKWFNGAQGCRDQRSEHFNGVDRSCAQVKLIENSNYEPCLVSLPCSDTSEALRRRSKAHAAMTTMAAGSGSPSSTNLPQQEFPLRCVDEVQQLVSNWPPQTKPQALQQRATLRCLEQQQQQKNQKEEKVMPPLARERKVTKHVQQRPHCTKSVSSQLTPLGHQLSWNQKVMGHSSSAQQLARDLPTPVYSCAYTCKPVSRSVTTSFQFVQA